MRAVARWAPHVALVAAIGALVVAREDRRALLLFIPLALAPGVGAQQVPRWLAKTAPVAARVAAVVAFAHAIAARSFLFVPDDVALKWAGALAWVLAVLGVVLVLGRGAWSAASTLVPVVVALLVLGSLGETNPLFTGLALAAAAALWVFAFVHGGPARRDRRLGAFAALAVTAMVGIALFLPWAQPRVERAVVARLGNAAAGFADRSKLGEFERLATSRRVVLRVWTSRPQRLRASVLTRFDGREWTPEPRGVERATARPLLPLRAGGQEWLAAGPGSLFLLPPSEAPPAPSEGVVETLVLPVSPGEWPVLHPAGAVLVRADASRLEPSGSGGLRFPLLENVARYDVVSRVAPRLEDAAPLSDPERAESLALPATVDPRLRIRARILADGAASDRERLARTVGWLRSEFAYTLDVGPFRTGDPVAEFLFEKRRGYCSFFASSAALLLRLQGVPTRYVKGFDVGPRNRVSDHYRVVEADAHAWIEAWLPGEGWVEADPTPGAVHVEAHAAAGTLESLLEWVRARGALGWAAFRGEGLSGGLLVALAAGRDIGSAALDRPRLLGVLLGVVVALAVVGGARPLLARWRSRPRSPRASLPPDVLGLLEAVERHWARGGRARPPSRGLQEHLESMPPADLSPAARATSALVVDAVYRCAYAGRPLPAEEVAALRRDVAGLD